MTVGCDCITQRKSDKMCPRIRGNCEDTYWQRKPKYGKHLARSRGTGGASIDTKSKTVLSGRRLVPAWSGTIPGWPTRQVEYQKGAAPPYEDLLKLAAKLQSTLPGRPHLLTKASETAVIEWSERNGPLGILLARWESLKLATQASRSAEIQPTVYVRAYGQGVFHYE